MAAQVQAPATQPSGLGKVLGLIGSIFSGGSTAGSIAGAAGAIRGDSSLGKAVGILGSGGSDSSPSSNSEVNSVGANKDFIGQGVTSPDALSKSVGQDMGQYDPMQSRLQSDPMYHVNNILQAMKDPSVPQSVRDDLAPAMLQMKHYGVDGSSQQGGM